ncbi:MAG: ABC transporter permease [Bacteroidota bacterium]
MLSLLKYASRRILEAIPLIFGLVTIVFFLSRLLPGDVTDALISPTIPQSVKEHLRGELGLDRSVLEQYFAWLRLVVSGDLGLSFTRNAPVLEVIGDVFPNTVILGSAALLIEIILGVLLVLPTFFYEGKWIEKVFTNLMLVVYTLPSFWTGVMLLIVFSYGLGLFPSSQMYSSGEFGSFIDLLRHVVLPALTAAIPAAAGFARYLRANVSSVMTQDYVLAARSMGLSDWRIFRSYVLPNAISPIVSLIGIEIGILLTGVLVTETLFSWPGMGQLTVTAIFSRDYPLILGCTLVSGVVVIAGNLISDIINAVVDPRIRLAQ